MQVPMQLHAAATHRYARAATTQHATQSHEPEKRMAANTQNGQQLPHLLCRRRVPQRLPLRHQRLALSLQGRLPGARLGHRGLKLGNLPLQLLALRSHKRTEANEL